MNIAVVNWTNRTVGGAEAHLADTVPELVRAGHSVTFVCEHDGPSDRAPIAGLDGARTITVEARGAEAALAETRWSRPDVIYVHGLLDAGFERRLLELAPAALFMHNYYGTCISGAKSFKFPTDRPCDRRFGAACLLNYYPRRCGGWNPATMVRDFRQQTERLRLLTQYRVVMVYSEHMRREAIKHGVPAGRVRTVFAHASLNAASVEPLPLTDGSAWRLVFAGRMDRTKGGTLLLDAMRHVALRVRRPLSLTFIGDGRDRRAWERQAARLVSECGVDCEFTGWLQGDAFLLHLRSNHLLVFPSCWAEPFGLVGLQAAAAGVPAAGFALGGVPEWLVDGVTGHLAPADPPEAAGLARAIVRCLSDASHYADLRAGAAAAAASRTRGRFVASVMDGLARAAAEHVPAQL